MSCWVAVSVAGEYLGVSSAELMRRIETGAVPSKYGLGMLMVDVKPGLSIPDRRIPDRNRHAPLRIPTRPMHESEIERVVERIDDPDFVEHDRFIDWRNARAQTMRARKAPLAA